MARRSVTEELWHAAAHPQNLWYAPFVRNERKRRLTLCACARRVLPVLHNDPRAVALLEACERHADSPPREARTIWKEVAAARVQLREFFREVDDEATTDRTRRRRAALYAVHTASDATVSRAFPTFNWVSTALCRKSPRAELAAQVAILHDIYGNPFHPVAFSPEWRTDTAVTLARTMYDDRDFSAMPILADALQDAGCDSAEVLDHCRGPGPHVRGCWVVDLVLGKEQ
jgi:hypothetical protein